MPPEATDLASKVDALYSFLLWASFISTMLVVGGLTYFAIKYKRTDKNQKSAYITHNNTLEFLWSFIPFLIFMGVFAWGWVLFHDMRNMPADALEVAVQGQQWDWTFTYKNGRRSSGEMVIPVNQPVKLVMASKDVIHSFYIPAFRLKQDVVPGRYTTLWFQPKYKGEYQVFCAEFCGRQHSGMLAKIKVVSQEEFDEWLGNDPYKGLSMVEVGHKVYSTRCVICHNLTDKKLVGPGWKDLFGHQVELADGSTVVADENYIRESILNPNAKIVKGFPPAMPTFAGQLDEQEIMGLVEFIKTLK
jgi:cytochrome c oxidase subunit 2